MKTGTHPMQTRLRLFLDWGISFGDPYLLPERAARTVAYASKQELEQAIFRCHYSQQTESSTPDEPPAAAKRPPSKGGSSYAQSRRINRDIPHYTEHLLSNFNKPVSFTLTGLLKISYSTIICSVFQNLPASLPRILPGPPPDQHR